jgi:zinc transporter ZupT
MPVNVWTVTAAAAFTALATGLGALPFRFFAPKERLWNAVASLLMIVASASLIWQGWKDGASRLALGVVLGVLFIGVVQRVTTGGKGFLIVTVMTAHSAAEGIGVGVSYGGGEKLGVFVTLLIALHNVPEGLAISAVMVPRGASVRSAALWSVFSSLPQPLIAPFAFLFVEEFKSVLGAGLGFAAGAMLWMVWSELLPDLRSGHAHGHGAYSHRRPRRRRADRAVPAADAADCEPEARDAASERIVQGARCPERPAPLG